MKIYVLVNEEQNVEGWSSTPGVNTVEVDIPENHSFFSDPFWFYSLSGGDLIKNSNLILEEEKRKKLDELDTKCNETILGRFTAEVKGSVYQFSNDVEAQTNFEKCDRAFEKGRITEITWTAYTTEGTVTRLTLSPEEFEIVYLAHLAHINDNISKFRDVLQPQVEAAKTVEEVQSIQW